jgi:methionine-S-sulfoxide reductase
LAPCTKRHKPPGRPWREAVEQREGRQQLYEALIVQGVFQHVEGVTSAVSGCTGGTATTTHYELVGTNTTGHAESVRVTFDPRRISYGRILQVYFSVAHDPTELNRQGPDVGTQYRSAIFPTNPEQTQVAEAYIAQLNQAHVFNAPIVTKVELGRDFYRAEDYHQDFLTRNPNYSYIVVNDLPKIEYLKRLGCALKVRFAHDSPGEGSGFEPSVPLGDGNVAVLRRRAHRRGGPARSVGARGAQSWRHCSAGRRDVKFLP